MVLPDLFLTQSPVPIALPSLRTNSSYLINARTNLPSGSEIRNVASISFDNQPQITTDQIDPHNPGAGIDPGKQALNTIDSGTPTSSVLPLSSVSGHSFWVQWGGWDDPNGSGVDNYDIYVSTNGGPFGIWLNEFTGSSNLFTGELGNSYAFYSQARDMVGNLEATPATAQAETTISTNSPILASVSNQTLPVGFPFNFTNLVAQGNPSGEYMFSLLQAPYGAEINSTNGTFQWTPSCEQGSSTNQVIVWVTDSGQTNLNDAAVFNLVVGECLLPQVGTLVLPIGGTSTLPIYLYSTEVLTNFAMSVKLPENILTATALEPAAPEICTNTLVQISNSLYEITLTACSDPWLQPTQGELVAWLYLTAASNQPSAFVHLNLGNSVGTQPDGVGVTNYVTQNVRVVIVGNEPLLDAVLDTNQQPALVLYGLTGTTNTLEFKTSLGSSTVWGPDQQIIMTNLEQIISPISLPEGQKNYRAWRP